MKSLFFIIFLALVMGCTPSDSQIPRARIRLLILDDDGHPIPNAQVKILGVNVMVKGVSDSSGAFLGELQNPTSGLDLQVDRDGYYSIIRKKFFFESSTNGQWLPWAPDVKLRLYRKANPTPMFVKQVEQEIPVLETPLGYDLMQGDWVEPYGRGKTADFIFEAKRSSGGNGHVGGYLRLTFSNKDDGLVPVRLSSTDEYELRLPALAPKDGYRSKYSWEVGSSEKQPGPEWKTENNLDQDANYYFRVRSGLNMSNEVTGLYGKIYRGIGIGLWTYRTNATINFLYYLNPNGSQNTEFDTRSNLCPNPGDFGGQP